MTKRRAKADADPLARFQEPTRVWFRETFAAPTSAQALAFPPILDGESTLLLSPTGSGKTLAAFLVAIDKLVFSPEPEKHQRCRLLYVSPLKALATDVERNLQLPLAGITKTAARLGQSFRTPTVSIRSGDTPTEERARFAKHPPDILITTPESLFLLLTSNAREALRSIDTVIVDEIHSLAATKRGTFLFLSLERLEALRASEKRLSRIGLSATQKPLDEIARLLGGFEPDAQGSFRPRPVTIVDARAPKVLELRIEMPTPEAIVPADKPEPGKRVADRAMSIWPSIQPRLVELIRAHRSTMIFANSRRLSERLAAAINETAAEDIARAHHGSLAREERQVIEEQLKHGHLPCIVATSSLELGLDLGAVDLVIQIEAPPSIASGLQRVGRAGHSVGAASRGIVFPKHRGDLLACAAATEQMLASNVEETFYPRNPLDVLAQQIVAIVSMDAVHEDALFSLVRRAAPFAELSRASFEGLCDMLSGLYPSDELAELRPRIVWDRTTGVMRAREGAKRIAVVNAGTIPDRGLYGVFLAVEGSSKGQARRVGELDEEMVFEARPGEVFVLGASSWRITEITHDRVLVVPAPGEPGKMPFWRGDRVGRTCALGQAIGALAREIHNAKKDEDALSKLQTKHKLDLVAATNLVKYIRDQALATGEVPSDRTLVLERFVDDVGDTRVCLLSPFGGRIHAPLASAIGERARAELGVELEIVWSDDGIVFRFPESLGVPSASMLLPKAEEVEDLVVSSLGTSALFSARFRECAGRALLLPKYRPGKRTPLWARRKKAQDLLQVTSQYGSFPILLETYREVLRDIFDMPALKDLLRRIEGRQVRVHEVETRAASPFAASLLFGYVGNFMYDGDLPLAERKAQMLAIDHARLRELLGEAELRELLDLPSIEALEKKLQRLEGKRPLSHADEAHDLLLSLGPLSEADMRARAGGASIDIFLNELLRDNRIIRVSIAGQERFAAIEDAGRLRDALGVSLPEGLPEAFLRPTREPLVDLISRYARTHGPFRAEDLARWYGLGVAPVKTALDLLIAKKRVTEGELLPAGIGHEYCDIEILRSLKQRSLARLRAEVEPAPPEAYARFLLDWHGISNPRRGADALLSTIELLQGAPLPALSLETEILPARVAGYRMGDIDSLCATGEVLWRVIEPLGEGAGRIALYLASAYPYLAPEPTRVEGSLAARIREVLQQRGAMFYTDLLRETGAFGHDLFTALWSLIDAGEVTNDTLAPLRSLAREKQPTGKRRPTRAPSFFSARRIGPPGSEGRFSLLPSLSTNTPSATEKRTALARVLLDRHGVLTREAAAAEGITGGFSAVYEVLSAMEQAGRVRRGYFVAGLGAAQFALPGAEDRLRAYRDQADQARPIILSACDPASPFGTSIPFASDDLPLAHRPKRMMGARVVIYDGRLLAWLSRGRVERALLTFLPSDDGSNASLRTKLWRMLAFALAALVDEGRLKVLWLMSVDSVPTDQSEIAPYLKEAGFVAMMDGYLRRPSTTSPSPSESALGAPNLRGGWGKPWASPASSSEEEGEDDFE